MFAHMTYTFIRLIECAIAPRRQPSQDSAKEDKRVISNGSAFTRDLLNPGLPNGTAARLKPNAGLHQVSASFLGRACFLVINDFEII